MKAFLLVLTFCSIKANGQSDSAAVKATINRFFEGMRASDSTMIQSTLAPTVIFQTIVQKEGAQTTVRTEKIAAFIKTVTKPHPGVYDERITFELVKIDAALAIAWTPYKFYVGSTFSHCGVNSFQLVKLDGSWKIQYIIDTRRKDPCP